MEISGDNSVGLNETERLGNDILNIVDDLQSATLSTDGSIESANVDINNDGKNDGTIARWTDDENKVHEKLNIDVDNDGNDEFLYHKVVAQDTEIGTFDALSFQVDVNDDKNPEYSLRINRGTDGKLNLDERMFDEISFEGAWSDLANAINFTERFIENVADNEGNEMDINADGIIGFSPKASESTSFPSRVKEPSLEI